MSTSRIIGLLKRNNAFFASTSSGLIVTERKDVNAVSCGVCLIGIEWRRARVMITTKPKYEVIRSSPHNSQCIKGTIVSLIK